MQAGLLNELIDIYKPELSSNEYGEQVQKYKKNKTTKAQVINNSGNREISNSEIVFTNNKTFRIRSYIEINETFLIVYQKKKYRILSIIENRKFNEKVVETELINE